MTAKSESALTFPEGIEFAQPLSRAARAVGVTERTFRSWVDAGWVKVLPTPPRKKRYVSLTEIARLEAKGFSVDWEKLFE